MTPVAIQDLENVSLKKERRESGAQHPRPPWAALNSHLSPRLLAVLPRASTSAAFGDSAEVGTLIAKVRLEGSVWERELRKLTII